MGERDTRTKNQEREQRILDATSTLIVRYGYDKTSVSDIAKEASVSKGAVYLHFSSKDDLLQQLILREMLSFTDILVERMRNDTSPHIFSSLYRHTLTVMKEDEFLWILFSKQRWLLGRAFINKQTQQGSTLYQQRMGLSQVMLTQLIKVGAIRQDINPEATAYVFNMLSYGYLKLGEVIPNELAPPTGDIIKEIGDLIQRYLEPVGDGNPDEARKIILESLLSGRQLIQQMLDNKPQKINQKE